MKSLTPLVARTDSAGASAGRAAGVVFGVCLIASMLIHVGTGAWVSVPSRRPGFTPGTPVSTRIATQPSRVRPDLRPKPPAPATRPARVRTPRLRPRAKLRPKPPAKPRAKPPKVRLPKARRRVTLSPPLPLHMVEKVVVRQMLPRQYKIGLRRRLPGPRKAVAARPHTRAPAVPLPPGLKTPQTPTRASALPVKTSPRGMRLGAPPVRRHRPARTSPIQTRARIFRKLTRPGDEKRLGAGRTAELRYLEAILQRIQAEMDRPDVTRALLGQKGIASVSMELDHLGVLHGGVQVLQPGTSPVFEKLLAQAIRRASPFPGFPVYMPYLRARVRIEAYLRVPMPEDSEDRSPP